MHLLYQVQVVSNDVYIRVSPAKPQKWQTQSALTEIPNFAKPPNLFICSHLRTPINVFQLGKTTIPENHWRTKVPAINIYLELFYFDTRLNFDQYLRESSKKPRKILWIPLEIKETNREKHKDILCKKRP
jgi:hypothetical protein